MTFQSTYHWLTECYGFFFFSYDLSSRNFVGCLAVLADLRTAAAAVNALSIVNRTFLLDLGLEV